jgi:hypothetical protein
MALQVNVCNVGLAKYNSRKYTSPERLTTFRCSKEDDAYAFGVLMYFLATSRTPFTDIAPQDLSRAIAKGVRPKLDEWAGTKRCEPEAQSLVVQPYCELARQCSHQQPEQRPGFETIYSRLTAIVLSACRCGGRVWRLSHLAAECG